LEHGPFSGVCKNKLVIAKIKEFGIYKNMSIQSQNMGLDKFLESGYYESRQK
jgi:hypothetical protein